MGINRQSDESTNLQVGPTTAGMVRIYVASDTIDLPMDFTPDDAEEIARELMAAAETARNAASRPPARSAATRGPQSGKGPPPSHPRPRGGARASGGPRSRRRDPAPRGPR